MLRNGPSYCGLHDTRSLGGVVWSSEDAQAPQHRLQTANHGVQYVKGRLGSVCRKRGLVLTRGGHKSEDET
eukprot:1179029-Prorocentrum_minimum.AAC.5